MTAYYNENDRFAAAWLRNLIAQNLIAPGDVDERSIEEVQASDLKGYTQCHFFAGIGVWSYALRKSGWSDDLRVWTGSCPCQGFSASGARGGFSDKRHLWPAWFRLIRESRPDTLLGEQVSSKDGLAWSDVVFADLENEAYTIGALDTCAAGLGAPHIRQRLYFVADTSSERRQQVGRGAPGNETENGREQDGNHVIASERAVSAMADTEYSQRGASATERNDDNRQETGREQGAGLFGELSETGGMEHSDGSRGLSQQISGTGTDEPLPTEKRGSINYWGDAVWIPCKDGKLRPTEAQSSLQCVADEYPAELGYVRYQDKACLSPLIEKGTNRVGRLRGYGNALVAEVAIAFIRAYKE